jgi:hypothetical protein
MPKKNSSWFRFAFTAFAFVVSATALTFIGLMLFGQNKTFPDLPVGAYVGKMSGISAGEKEAASLYVERIRNANSLLFVVFREGWKPQIVSTEQAEAKQALSFFGSRQRSLVPPVVRSNENSFTLSGSNSVNGYSGQVISGDQRHGTWSLSPVSINDLRQPSPISGDVLDLREWLRLKAKLNSLTREDRSLEATIAENRDRQGKLAKFLKQENLLRVRAKERQDSFVSELKDLSVKQEAKTEEVKQLVRELEQLTRITKKGQTVELARRVAKREAKWYSVNWQTGADLSSLEEGLAEKMNVDLNKLRSNIKRAAEVQALKNTVAQERARVLKLQGLYQEKIDSASRKRPPAGETREGTANRPWWKGWDSLIGGGDDE